MAVVDAKDARSLAADRAHIALPRLQRAILRKREPIAAGALSVAIVGLQRSAYAAAVVLQKARALAANALAGRFVLVGKRAAQSCLDPVPARAHRPGGLRNVRGMV